MVVTITNEVEFSFLYDEFEQVDQTTITAGKKVVFTYGDLDGLAVLDGGKLELHFMYRAV